MPEVHVNISTNASNNQIVFHNPGQHPLPPSAGKAVVAATKPAGQANTKVNGQVSNTTVVFDNPG